MLTIFNIPVSQDQSFFGVLLDIAQMMSGDASSKDDHLQDARLDAVQIEQVKTIVSLNDRLDEKKVF